MIISNSIGKLFRKFFYSEVIHLIANREYEHTLIVISPWITNFSFPIRISIEPWTNIESLYEVFSFLLERGCKIKVLCRTLEEWLNVRLIPLVKELTKSTPSHTVIDILRELVKDIKYAINMIDFIVKIYEKGAEVRFMRHLHTKLYINCTYILFGSANLTNTATNINEEMLMLINREEHEDMYRRFVRYSSSLFKKAEEFEVSCNRLLYYISKVLHIHFKDLYEVIDYINQLLLDITM